MSTVDNGLQGLRLGDLGESGDASRVDKVLEFSRPFNMTVGHPEKSLHFGIQDSHALLPLPLVDQLALGYAPYCVLCWQNWPTEARIAQLAKEASLSFTSKTSGHSLSDKNL